MSELKLFNRWDTESIEVGDAGLKGYINLKQVLIPRSHGRHAVGQFYKSTQLHIIERLINHLFVPGHRGKKHLLTSGRCAGKSTTAYKLVKRALELIEERTKKNPVEIFVRALEAAAIREEITSFQVGGIIVRRAVITAPQRRIDLAMRLLTQGAYQKAFGGRKVMAQALADEILATYSYDAQNSYAIREKERIEREAAGAR